MRSFSFAQRWRITAQVLTRASSNHGSALLSMMVTILKWRSSHA